jgi:hypothetical protein
MRKAEDAFINASSAFLNIEVILSDDLLQNQRTVAHQPFIPLHTHLKSTQWAFYIVGSLLTLTL